MVASHNVCSLVEEANWSKLDTEGGTQKWGSDTGHTNKNPISECPSRAHPTATFPFNYCGASKI